MSVDIKGLSKGQLGDLIRRAESRQKEISKEELNMARKKVVSIAKASGFTMEELVGFSPTVRKVKFRNPSNPSQTWSGRGKHPNWFNEALKAGKTEQELLAA